MNVSAGYVIGMVFGMVAMALISLVDKRLKAIRRGEWKEQQVCDFFEQKEALLERLYEENNLPWGPDEDAIKALLLNCLEEHYGALPIVVPGRDRVALEEIARVLERRGL